MVGAEAAGRVGRAAPPASPEAPLSLEWRPYRFALPRALVTSQGAWSLRRGWLLRLEAADGRLGWGEAALPAAATAAWALGTANAPAPEPDCRQGDAIGSGSPTGWSASGLEDGEAADEAADLQAAVRRLPAVLGRQALEAQLPSLPQPLACALGMALAELDGLGSADQGGWLAAPASAVLLPAGEAAIAALEQALTGLLGKAPLEHGQAGASALTRPEPTASGRTAPLTIKWKVASDDDALERRVLEHLLERLPADGRLRLDANGGWDRANAGRWADRLIGERRLEWLEQPLPPGDRDGLEALGRRLPVALDESLRLDPELMGGWRGWQVRRPLAEGDPRPLLAALLAGTPRLMLSTALETGIGRRFLAHLAGLQALGPTPTAPGLAPGWRPRGALFAREPGTVWQAAGLTP